MADLDAVRPLEPTDVPYVTEAVRLLVAELGDTPLIGFAGAPFTLASYLVEGGPSKDYAKTKSMMVGEPELWHQLCSRLAQISAAFLLVQVQAGAAAVQLFDSWAGSLSAADYTRFAQPYSAAVLAAVAETGVPRIHFGVGTGELLPAMGEAGAEVVGVDWRLPLAEASRRIGPAYAVQGNLDPALLQAPWPVLAERVREVVRSGAWPPGTCSTWVTAYRRTPIRTCWPASSTWCTPRARGCGPRSAPSSRPSWRPPADEPGGRRRRRRDQRAERGARARRRPAWR